MILERTDFPWFLCKTIFLELINVNNNSVLKLEGVLAYYWVARLRVHSPVEYYRKINFFHDQKKPKYCRNVTSICKDAIKNDGFKYLLFKVRFIQGQKILPQVLQEVVFIFFLWFYIFPTVLTLYNECWNP